MKERESERDPYWGEDITIGEGTFYRDQSYAIRMKLHTSLERSREREELMRLSHPVTDKTYVHARPYILEPQIILTLGMYPQPTQEGVIGEVESSDWTGMRHQDIGNAQAWYYHKDQLLVLWECYLYDFARSQLPRDDTNLAAVWSGFESHLQERFPDTQRIVTPSWEDIYERTDWQAFLQQRGYRPLNNQAFLKEVGQK